MTGADRERDRDGNGARDGDRDRAREADRDRDGDRERAQALAHVRGLLLAAGATDEEVERAVAEGVLDLLAVDRLLLPADRRYTAGQVAEATGMPADQLQRFWRALGFLDVPADEPAFTDLDLRAVGLFQAMVQAGATEVGTALQLARVIGSSMARIAEAELMSGSFSVDAEQDDVLAADAFASMAGETVPAMAWLLELVWRRHVQAATRRTMLLRASSRSSPAGPLLAVGFADMVGFTLLSQHLRQDELAAVVQRFEEISHDIVTGLGGRVVKMIGDEVMFVVESVAAAARIGLGLAEAYADDELLSDVRVGLAFGPVLVHDGDYFGPAVNLSHRIVSIARPGTVLMSDELHQRLAAEAGDELVGRPLRPRVLKDLGRVQLWRCARKGPAGAAADGGSDRQRGLRWERLTEVLRDLDEVREAGERLLLGGGRPPREPVHDAGVPTPGAGPTAPPSGAGQAEGGDAVGA